MLSQRLQDFGPYRIVRLIATGGMAEVYEARQRAIEGLERTVVLKRILERYADDEEFITMFLDEARLLAALSHPNIAQVLDLGKVEGAYYLTMEHVRGPTLGKLLAVVRAGGDGRLPIKEALGIGLAIAEALHYVHERRDELGRPLDIVHRDLNPANVLVSYDGAVKLIDFGIAKAATKVYETRAGVVKGTYGYIAPEQLVGTTKVDRRADVFALGILLYEMCVGQHPYDVSDEPNLIDRILEARYRRPREVLPDIPRDLDRLIASCLSPHPEGRPSDVGEVIDALAKHLGEQGMVPTQTALAALTRRLVPDERGASPLRPLTQPERPRPFGKDPTRTRQLGAEAIRRVPSTQPQAQAKAQAQASSVPSTEPQADAAARSMPRTALARPPASGGWTGTEIDLDDEPMTIATSDPSAGVPTSALLQAPGPDEPPTLSKHDLGRPEPDPLAGFPPHGADEEAPTQLLALDASPRASVPPPGYAPPVVRRPPPVRALPSPWVIAGGLAGLFTMGVLAFFAVQALRGGDEPRRVAVPIAAPDAAVAPEPPAGPSELSVVSEPPGAHVHVNGHLVDGVTPLTLPIAAGAEEVWLRLSKEGFAHQEREVSVAVGEARFVLAPLDVDRGPADAGLDAGDLAEGNAAPARPRRRRRRRR